MGTTNYRSTFITAAADCPAEVGEAPAGGMAGLQYEVLAQAPAYSMTSDDLLFETERRRKNLQGTAEQRAAFFAKPQPCLRASPLPKRYGWGIHHDENGRVALVARGGEEYRRLSSSPEVKVVPAMRNKRPG